MQLVRHLTQVIPRRDVGLVGAVGEVDRVGIEVEDLFLEEVEVLVQLEASVTGGEGGDEEDDAPDVHLGVFGIGVDHFQGVGVADPHRVKVVGGVGDEMEEMRGVVTTCVEGLHRFAPEGVEHEFGRGFPVRVLDEALRVEDDALAVSVGLDVELFIYGSAGPTRIASGFLLDL